MVEFEQAGAENLIPNPAAIPTPATTTIPNQASAVVQVPKATSPSPGSSAAVSRLVSSTVNQSTNAGGGGVVGGAIVSTASTSNLKRAGRPALSRKTIDAGTSVVETSIAGKSGFKLETQSKIAKVTVFLNLLLSSNFFKKSSRF